MSPDPTTPSAVSTVSHSPRQLTSAHSQWRFPPILLTPLVQLTIQMDNPPWQLQPGPLFVSHVDKYTSGA